MKPRCIVGISRYKHIAVFNTDNKLLNSGKLHKLKSLTKDMKILRFYVSDQCNLSECISLNAPVNIVSEEIWRKYFTLCNSDGKGIKQKVLKIVPGTKLSISSLEAEAVLIGLKGLGTKLS